MSAPLFWINVQAEGQVGALGSAKTITGITKANPAVVTSTAHGLTTGDVVVMNVSGMTQIQGRSFRVTSASADTFSLDGEDSTTYGTFTSGTCREATIAVGASTLQDITVSGGDTEYADTSTIHEDLKRRAPTTKSPITMACTSLFIGGDPFLVEMNKADKTKTTRVIRLTFSDGTEVLGNAYVSCPMVPTGSTGQAVQTPLSFEMQGMPNLYEPT